MWDKIGYIVYSPMLKFYLKYRVKMAHIWYIITFRLANWLKSAFV